jgi:AraC-like DNA-binding protein
MVSNRCKMMVHDELEKLGLHSFSLELGVVDIKEDVSDEMRARLKVALLRSGLELMDDKRAMLIERIKNVVVKMVHHSEEVPLQKFSVYLSEQLDYDYTYLANLFSETEGITIEQFVLLHKIERVKELLIYDEYNLTEIAYQMNYSSVAALSNQFKKITGLTPSFYKGLKDKRRTALENV